MFSGSSNPRELLGILSDVTGSWKLKMAVAKPEVLISQLVGKIATRFQRLPHVSGVQQRKGAIGNTLRCNLKLEIKDGGR